MDFGTKKLNEAKEAFNDALNRDDYETAEEIYNQFPEIDLISELVAKSKTITKYLNEKDDLTQQADSNTINYEQQIQSRIEEVQSKYAKRLETLKQKQQLELNSVFEKWRSQNAEIESNSNQDYVQTIQTARLVAGQANFQEAKKMRDTAFSNSNATIMKTKAQISKKYQKVIESMSHRHKYELSQLIQNRDQEIRELKYELSVSQQTAVDCYAVDNADAVATNIQNTNDIMPLALIMQIQNKEPENTESETLSKSGKNFNQKMKTYQKLMSTTGLRTDKKKPASKSKSLHSNSYKMSTMK